MTPRGRPNFLTPEQERKIVTLREMGVKLNMLAQRFGVATSTIHCILSRQRDAKGGSQ